MQKKRREFAFVFSFAFAFGVKKFFSISFNEKNKNEMCDSILKNMHQFDMLKHALRTILTMQRSSMKQLNCMKMLRNKINFNEISQNCDNVKNLKQLTRKNSETVTMYHNNNMKLVNTQRKRLEIFNRNQLNSQNHSEMMMHSRSSNKFLRSSKLNKNKICVHFFLVANSKYFISIVILPGFFC